MRKTTIYISSALGAALLFFLGVLVGAHMGAREFVLMEGSVRASLLAGELSSLRAGSTHNLINAKELELDSEVVRAMQFQGGNHAWLLWPDAKAYDHARYLARVAQYRTQFPAFTPTVTPLGTPYAADVEQATNRLLRAYGK